MVHLTFLPTFNGVHGQFMLVGSFKAAAAPIMRNLLLMIRWIFEMCQKLRVVDASITAVFANPKLRLGLRSRLWFWLWNRLWLGLGGRLGFGLGGRLGFGLRNRLRLGLGGRSRLRLGLGRRLRLNRRLRGRIGIARRNRSARGG